MHVADPNQPVDKDRIDDLSFAFAIAVLDASGNVVAANTTARESLQAKPGLRFATLLFDPNENGTDDEHDARWQLLKATLNRWLPLKLHSAAGGVRHSRARLERAHGGAGSYIICLQLEPAS